jgi:hypothetical protein
MQRQLDDEAPSQVVLLTVNEAGYEAGNAEFIVDKTMPLLQDTPKGAWSLWQVAWRDVVVVDALGRRRDVFNLTQNDLSTAANFDTLKTKLLQARTP